MTVETKFPLTRMEIAQLAGPKQSIVRFPASFDEYWELLAEAEYTADFYQNEIIVPISYESKPHSKLTLKIGAELLAATAGKKDFAALNINRPLYLADCKEDGAVFNPDASVIQEPSQFFEYQKGMNAETTPVVIAEVLSKSTSDYDYDTKLPCYKKVPTVRQIIYISSLRHFVTVWERDHETARWTNTDYDQPDDMVNILGHSLRLGDLYQNVFFE